MIANIVQDSIPYLFLLTTILFGFGVALPVMLRSRSERDQENDNSDSGDEDVKSVIENDFGSFDKSLMTLFYAMLGAFDKEVRIP